MNYVISKDFSFSAAHYLNGLDEEHPCSRMHGHNYIVRVELISDTLNAIGFVVDYRDLSPIKDWLNKELDHRCLNEVIAANPTAENLAMHIAKIIRKVTNIPREARVAVGVSETAKTWARYAE